VVNELAALATDAGILTSLENMPVIRHRLLMILTSLVQMQEMVLHTLGILISLAHKLD
jgi:hypothetical protein